MNLDSTLVRSTALIGFADLVTELGGAADDLLFEADLKPRFTDPRGIFFSYPKFVELMEIAAMRLETSDFGLRLAQRNLPHFANLGPVVFLAYFASNLRSWYRSIVRYNSFRNNGLQFRLQEDSHEQLARCLISFHPKLEKKPQINENLIATISGLIGSQLGMTDFSPKYIRFCHSKPAKTELLDSIFSCPMGFNCPELEIAFDLDLLDRPVHQDPSALREVVEVYTKFHIPNLDDDNIAFSHQAELATEMILGTGRCNLENVALALGMHPKKLQRNLAAEGKNFSQLLETVRSNLARKLLLESQIPVNKLAGYLGYAQSAPFSLAFKRWTGVGPREFRNQRLSRLRETS